MPKALTIYDPYRKKATTIREFAVAEGVPKRAVSHYYWYHNGTIEGFRDRPEKGKGNGIKPHTYTKNGIFISITEASKITLGGSSALLFWRERGITDIDEINRRQRIRHAEIRQRRLHEADDGKNYTLSEYAKLQGVTLGTVREWRRHHKGSLKGFTTRGHSRVNPTLYPHKGLGVSKTKRGWAKYYGVGIENIKSYLYTHNKCMDGYVPRGFRTITHDGRTATVHECRHMRSRQRG